MQSPLRRRIRHARRFIGYGLLVVLILAATAVGVVNQMLPLVERNPEKVAAWLTERVGQTVAFSHARAEWTRRGPRFTLDDLRIGEGETVLDIGRAELLVAVYSGFLPGAQLTELKVRDLSLALEQGEDRRWRMVGLPFQPLPGVDPLDTLEALGELQVERARLVVRSPAFKRELSLPRVDLRLRINGRQLRAGVQAWAVLQGKPLTAVVDLERGTWSGRLWAGGKGLVLDNWSPLLADTGLVVSGSGNVDLWARIDAQRVMDVRSRAELAPFALGARRPWRSNADGTLSSPPVAFVRADLLARWQVDDNGWQLHAPELHFQEAGRAEPLSFDNLWVAGGQRFALQAPHMDLAPARALATLSDALPPGLREWLHEAAPDGQLRDVRVHGTEGAWSGSARLDDVAWNHYGDRPGLRGLAGTAAFDQDGGVFRLGDAPVRFDWPRFREPMDLRVKGTLGWWRSGGQWTLGATGLRVRADDFGVLARAELQFPGKGAAPRLDLAAEVDPFTVQAAKKFWVVGKMPPATIDWLDNALQEGTLELGRAVLGGELANWPFRDNGGRFDARVRMVQGQVAFNPEWPVAQALDLDISFDGPGMALDGSGEILDNRVGRVAGDIEDFRDPRLRLDIDTAARGESLQALMLASPLRARYEDHLVNARIQGPATVALKLDLPLAKRLGELSIEGSLDLSGARLSDPRWGIAFTEVTGRTRFSHRGFATQDLAVVFEGEPGRFNLTVGDEFTGSNTVAARATLDGEFSPQVLLARHEPLAWLKPWLTGRSAWRLALEVPQPVPGAPTAPARLDIQSDLVGTTIGLPAPLAKQAGTPMPLSLQAPLPVDAGNISLRLGEQMRLRGRMGTGSALSGLIEFGPGAERALPAEGLVVVGATETLDAAGWIGFAAKGDGTAALRSVDVRVAELDLLGSVFADARLQLKRETGLTRLALSGATIEGTVTIPTDLALGVQGQFERLHWPSKPDEPAPTGGAQAFAVPELPAQGQDPSALPPLQFTVADLRVGATELGEAQLQAKPVPRGLRVERFNTRSDGIELTATGDWLNLEQGGSRSNFDVQFQARSLGELLASFGLVGMVEDGETKGRLRGSWPGSPGAFELVNFDGLLAAEVGEGQLLEVEPGGGGRVLGLLSLAEIPRRLSLDFSDFFEKGFGFNTMSGEFVFADGRASTELLQINGPAAEIRVSGSTDLRLQQYDQRIEVLPKAGGALPVLGALAGGPVGAAVGAVAQAVLQQPLKQAARTVYRISGPWKDPQIEVIEKGPPPASPGRD